MSSRCDRGDSIRLFRYLLPLLALVPPEGYIPDFFTPPPRSLLEPPEDELERVRRTPPAQVVKA